MKKIVLLMLFISIICLSSCLSTGEQTVGQEQLHQQPVTFENQLSLLAMKLTPETSDKDRKATAAILPFSTESGAIALENYVQEIMYEAFFYLNCFKLIERSAMNKLLEEQKLGNSGYIDENTAKGIGHMIGVDYICFGSLTDFGSYYKVSAKIADVATGEIISVASVQAPRGNHLDRLLASSEIRTQANTKKNSVNEVNSLWQVKINRNEFDGYTTYTLILPGTGKEYILVGYDKWDMPARSVVRVGFKWGVYYDTRGTYEIKDLQGNIFKKDYGYVYWSKTTGLKESGDKESISHPRQGNARWLLELLVNNSVLTVRHDDGVIRFHTEGLLETFNKVGITWEELDNALRNEEF